MTRQYCCCCPPLPFLAAARVSIQPHIHTRAQTRAKQNVRRAAGATGLCEVKSASHEPKKSTTSSLSNGARQADPRAVPAVLPPRGLVFFGARREDRAERRASRDLQTGQVGAR